MIICAGDFTSTGTIPEFSAFMHWFSNLDQYEHKLVINGNHELGFWKQPDLFKSMIPENVTLLHDSDVTIEGIKFYGTCHTQEYYNWAFPYFDEEEAAVLWAKIPDDTDFLIAHQPAYGVNDYVKRLDTGEDDHRIGCKVLMNRIKEVSPKVFVSGHLHDSANYGTVKQGETLFVSACTCDDNYVPLRKPIVLDYDNYLSEVTVVE